MLKGAPNKRKPREPHELYQNETVTIDLTEWKIAPKLRFHNNNTKSELQTLEEMYK